MPVRNLKTIQHFSQYIEDLVANGYDYVDAITSYCEKFNIDIEAAASMIKSQPKLKSGLQDECIQLNRLRKDD